MRCRLSVLLLLALSALPAASCSGDGTGPEPMPTPETFAATYRLEANDGQPLPVVWSETDTTALHVSRRPVHRPG